MSLCRGLAPALVAAGAYKTRFAGCPEINVAGQVFPVRSRVGGACLTYGQPNSLGDGVDGQQQECGCLRRCVYKSGNMRNVRGGNCACYHWWVCPSRGSKPADWQRVQIRPGTYEPDRFRLAPGKTQEPLQAPWRLRDEGNRSPELGTQTIKKFCTRHGAYLAAIDLGITALGFECPCFFNLSVSSQARNQAVQEVRTRTGRKFQNFCFESF